MTQVYQDVACTACGCVCDDLRITVDQNQVTRFEPPCPLAEQWFKQANQVSSTLAWIDEQPCDLASALDRAANILQHARLPLIYGLASSSTPGQRAAVTLADRLGAVIDTAASSCHGPSILAIQQVGESTCTLGEIKNRADLVIYWGSNPVKNHPRHLERYSMDPLGMFVPEGRGGRTLVVIDKERTASAEQADHFIQVGANCDFEIFWALRAMLRGVSIDAEQIGGVAKQVWQELLERMKHCRCGVFFFGRGLTQHATAHATVEALLLLTRELNDVTRFHARRMRVYGDVAGADSVLCWQTGFPFSVNLANGVPRYNPGEYSAQHLLAAKEVDACVFIGNEGIASFSAEAAEQMRSIPTIALGSPGTLWPLAPHVRFATSTYGIHAPGTAYRMDEVPIPLRSYLSTNLPRDADVLIALQQRMQASK